MQELFRRDKERILLKNAADNDHRMGPHDVDDRVSSELPEMIRADDGVLVMLPDFIYARLEFHQIVDVRLTFGRPVHAANNAAKRKSSLGVGTGQLFKRFQHPVLIETALAKVRFGVGPQLELPTLPRRLWIDPNLGQSPQMVGML